MILCPFYPLNCQTLISGEKKQYSFWDEQNKGIYNLTTFSPISFSGHYLNGVQTIFGYKFNPHLYLGGGIGFERFTSMPTYDNFTANLTLMPVFADFRYVVLKKKISPVLAVDAGYKVLLNIPSTQFILHTDTIFSGSVWTDYYDNDTYKKGGFFITIEAGIKMNIFKRVLIYGSADYSLWSISGNHNFWIYEYLPGSGSGSTLKVSEIVSPTLAYTHIFLVRLGIGF